MQIFRPYKNHKQSAKYLDDKRLNKQVVECFQLIQTCLVKLKLIEGKMAHKHHPITKVIYNNGKPYLPDLLNYMIACDKEWIDRGRNRKDEFKHKINSMINIIDSNKDLFCGDNIPEYYCFGGTIKYGSEIYDSYKGLLGNKWENDKIVVKCSIKI